MSVFICPMGAQDIKTTILITVVVYIKFGSLNLYHFFCFCRVITTTHFREDQRKGAETDAKMIHLVFATVSFRVRDRQVRIIGNCCCVIPNLKLN